MRAIFWLAIGLFVPSFLIAQDVDISSPPGDKEFGEEEQIKARELWFIKSRGLDTAARPDLAYRTSLRKVKQDIANRGAGGELQWNQVGPEPMTMLNWAMGKVAGRVSCFTYDPDDVNTLYLGTASGGVWKSTNGGSSWTPIFNDVGTQTIGSIYVSPAPNKRIWVGTGEKGQSCGSYFGLGVWVSNDEGTSFTEANGSGANTLDGSFVTAITGNASDPNLILAGAEGYCEDGSFNVSGLYRTTDAGQNWTLVLNGQITDIANHPDNPNTYYASVGKFSDANGGLYRSLDAGQSWSRLENGILSGTSFGRTRLAIAPSDPMTIYALVYRGAVWLYKSVDGGDTWTSQNTNACEGQCSYNLCISVHPTDPDTILVGSIRHFRSTDSGTTLVPLTTGWGGGQTVHQDTHVVYYDHGGTGRAADPNRYWVGTDGGLWTTTDGGNNYQHLNNGLNITQFYDVEVHPNTFDLLFGGAQDNSSSRGNSNPEWNVTVVTGDGFMNAVDPNNPNNVFQNSYPQSGFPNIARSTSGGAPGTFSFIGTNGITSGPFPWVTPMDISYDGNATALFVGSDRIFRSTNNGSNWTNISGDLSNGSINIINSEVVGGNVVILVGTQDGRIHRSLDGMAANPVFEEITSNYPGGNVSDVAVDPTSTDRLFVTRAAFGQNKLYRSTNGGATWDPVGTGLPDVPANTVAIDPLQPQRIFVGTDIGVFKSDNNGDTFVPYMEGMPLGAVVTDLEIDDSPYLLTAGTYGRSAWQIPLAILSANADSVLGCLTMPLTLSPSTAGGSPPYTYNWSILSGPDTNVSQFDDPNSSEPSFAPTATGNYMIRMTVNDNGGQNLVVDFQAQIFDEASFPLAQIAQWHQDDEAPDWVVGFDTNGDGVIDAIDLISEVNSPTCPVVNP